MKQREIYVEGAGPNNNMAMWVSQAEEMPVTHVTFLMLILAESQNNIDYMDFDDIIFILSGICNFHQSSEWNQLHFGYSYLIYNIYHSC